MAYAADFSSDETCATFAEFIDKATKLEMCNTYGQKGERYVTAFVKVATAKEEGKPGFIRLTDVKDI